MAANKKLNATVVIGGAVSQTLKSALGQTTRGMDKIGDSVRRLNREQKLLGSSIQQLGKAGMNVDGLRTRYTKVTAELEKQRGLMSRIQAAEERRNAAIAKRGQLMGSMYKLMGATVAVGGAALVAGRNAAKQQADLQNIANTADMSDAERDAMGKQLVQASRQTGRSVEELTAGLGYLVAAGMSVNDAIQNVELLGKAATAAGGDIDNLAQTGFTLNNTVGVAVGQTVKAFDILAQAGKAGNFELAEMSKHVPSIGAQFKALNIQGIEAVATMGAMFQIAREGAGTSDEAANNMENFLAKATAPDTLKKFQKLYGIDLYGEMLSAQQRGDNPLEYVIKRTQQLTQGDAAKVAELFGDRQVLGFLRPMMAQWEKYQEIKNEALGADGVIEKDYARMMETAQQQGLAIGAAFDRLSKTIGSALLPAFGKLSAAIIPVIDRMTAWTDANPELTKGIIGVTGAALALGTAFTALRIAGTFISPIGLAVGALAGAAVLVVKHWEPIKAFWADLWASAKSVAGEAWESILGGLRALDPVALVKKAWDPVKSYFSGLLDDITGIFTRSFEWIVGKIEAVGQAWNDTKSFFGMGDDSQRSLMDGHTAPDAAPNPVPRWQTQAAQAALNDNRTINMSVHAAPGMDPEQVADIAVRKMDHRQGVRQRSSMYDLATP